MSAHRIFASSFVLGLLAACSGSGVADFGVSGSVGGGPAEFADSAADTFEAKSGSGGVTGNMYFYAPDGNSATKNNATLSFSPDYTTAELTVGGRTYTFTRLPSTIYTDGDGGTLWTVSSAGTYSDVVGYSDAEMFGLGILGAETRPENLPDTEWRYDGLYSLATTDPASPQFRSGNTTFFVDFSTGNIVGEFTNSGSPTGTVTGSVVGNDIDATVDFAQLGISGTLDMEGTFYGPGAEEAAGILTGVLTTSTGAETMLGTFQAFYYEEPP